VLVQLKEVKDRYLPDLDSIKSDVLRDLYAARAATALQEQMTAARQQAKTESLEQIKQQYDVSLRNTGFVDLSDQKAADALKDIGIPGAYFMALEKVGATLEYQDNAHGYLIQLDEQEPLSDQVYQEKKTSVQKDLYRETIQRYVEDFVASLHRIATIDLNESIIHKLKDRAS